MHLWPSRNRRARNLAGGLLAAAMLVVLSAGCENPPTTIGVEDSAVDPTLPPPVVDLPQAPPSSAFVVPETNADGSLRIEGLIARREQYLTKEVKVGGMVAFISPACDPKQAKKKEEECDRPYMIIKDDKDGFHQMMVVGYEDEFLRRAKLESGQRRVFTGTYQRMSQGFVATEDGLLEVSAADDVPVVEEKPVRGRR